MYFQGICTVCGKSKILNNAHYDCESKYTELMETVAKNEKDLLKVYSKEGKYGVTDKSKKSFDICLKALMNYLKNEINFTEDEIIEGNQWWFFPQISIGICGFIVEKSTQSIFPIGSGWAGTDKNQDAKGPYDAKWSGIKAYCEGKVPSANT